MSLTTHKGKISSIYFGLGGYQESMLGLHICFSFEMHKFIYTSDASWDYYSVPHTDRSKWTEQARLDKYASITCSISELLAKAKVRDTGSLKNKEVTLTMDGLQLYSWELVC